jgi:hypothetical protein
MPDLDGNEQLTTLGNRRGDDRAMLVHVGFSARRRLKLRRHAQALQGLHWSAGADWEEAPGGLLFSPFNPLWKPEHA